MAWSARNIGGLSSAAWVTATLLVGCARFESKPLVPEQTASEFESRTLDSPALHGFLQKNLKRELPCWPLATWDFNTLTLAALYYHPSLDVARAQWGMAQAAEIAAGQRPNPTVGASPGYNMDTLSGVTPWLAFVDVDIPLETAGKRGYRLAQARHLTQAARLNIATVAWQVRANLRAALLDWQAAGEREKLLGQQLVTHEKIVQRLEQNVASGAAARSEILPSRIASEKARLDLAAAERLRSDARVRVAEAVGIPTGALEGSTLVFPAEPPGSIDEKFTAPEARRLALHSRPDILGALAEYAASQSALQLEIARQYPDIRLKPGYEYDQGENKWSLGLSVDLPLLHQNQGAIAEAKARRTAAAARFLTIQAQAIGELDRAWTGCQVSRQQLTNVDALQATQREHERNAQRLLAAGSAEQRDVLNAQLEMGTGELARGEAQLRFQQALGQLEDALQVPLDFVPIQAIEVGRVAKPEPSP